MIDEFDVQVAASLSVLVDVVDLAEAYPAQASSASTALTRAATSLPHSPGPAAALSSFLTMTVAPTITAVVGASNQPESRRRLLCDVRGHPLIGEPFGRWDRAGVRLPHGVAVPRAVEDGLRPDRVVVIGRLTLSRSLAGLLRLPGVEVVLVTDGGRWPDPGHVVHAVYPAGALSVGASTASSVIEGKSSAAYPTSAAANGAAENGDVDAAGFRRRWRAACAEAGRAVAGELRWPSGAALADAVLSALPDGSVLFLGSSNGVRHVDRVRGLRGRDEIDVVASRGLAGIDGCVSTAAGIALTSGRPTYALLGDLTFLHDANGLLIGPDEPQVDLTIVVGNDDGGAIFAGLEYGQSERRAAFPGVFERVFRTPTGTELSSLCRAHGVRHVQAATADEVRAALSTPPQGVTVVEVHVAS